MSGPVKEAKKSGTKKRARPSSISGEKERKDSLKEESMRPSKIAKSVETHSDDDTTIAKCEPIDAAAVTLPQTEPAVPDGDQDDPLKYLPYKMEKASINPYSPASLPVHVMHYKIGTHMIKLKKRPHFSVPSGLDPGSTPTESFPFSHFNIDESLIGEKARASVPKSVHPFEQQWLDSEQVTGSDNVLDMRENFCKSAFVDPFKFGDGDIVVRVTIYDGPVTENMMVAAVEQVLEQPVCFKVRHDLMVAADIDEKGDDDPDNPLHDDRYRTLGSFLHKQRTFVGISPSTDIAFEDLKNQDDVVYEVHLESPVEW